MPDLATAGCTESRGSSHRFEEKNVPLRQGGETTREKCIGLPQKKKRKNAMESVLHGPNCCDEGGRGLGGRFQSWVKRCGKEKREKRAEAQIW